MFTYSFENLEVWKRARAFRKDIYQLTAAFPRFEVFGLTSQIRRSASSISDCLAEGAGKTSPDDKARYTNIAFGSALETLNHLIGALDLGYINTEEYARLRGRLEEITFFLDRLYKAQKRSKRNM
jgi:four helix bundle protein